MPHNKCTYAHIALGAITLYTLYNAYTPQLLEPVLFYKHTTQCFTLPAIKLLLRLKISCYSFE